MEPFKSKTELIQLTIKRRIYIWTPLGFILVTQKALKDLIRAHKTVTGMYEFSGPYAVLIGF